MSLPVEARSSEQFILSRRASSRFWGELHSISSNLLMVSVISWFYVVVNGEIVCLYLYRPFCFEAVMYADILESLRRTLRGFSIEKEWFSRMVCACAPAPEDRLTPDAVLPVCFYPNVRTFCAVFW